MINYHALKTEAVLGSLNSSERGISIDDAERRLANDGPNVLLEEKEENLIQIFLRQFKSPLIYVLLAATLVVVALGDLSDGILILFVLLVNAFIGTFQESKAEKTMKSLKDFSKGHAVVMREGAEAEIDDVNVVIGDIIILRSGDKVPADARIINTQTLKVDEAALTGESEPVEKNEGVLPLGTPMPDRTNMLYKSTLAVAGEATAVVVATGQNTFIGSIASKLAQVESEAPLEKKIRELSKIIGIFVVLAVMLVVAIGLLRGFALREIFFTATAIAVSIIPEGLPVVITLILAKGVYRMAKRNALVKNMQAVEALGQASVIAVDKTGTITKNELTIQKVFVDNKEFSISGLGYKAEGDLFLAGKVVDGANHPEALLAGKIAALSSSASVTYLGDDEIKIGGDPTEAALLVFGQKLGFKKSELLSEEPIILEEPFSYEHKFHMVVNRVKSGFLTSVVGEPESILNRVGSIWSMAGTRPITEADRILITDGIKKFSLDGLRIIAFAIHESTNAIVDLESLPPLSFVGFYGMADVLREEVAESVDEARANGLRTVMITGDHLGTAEAIGRKAHIFREGDKVLSGEDLKNMSVDELTRGLSNVSVFGRVLPEHKLTIVEAYKLRGDIIGMTGDGVNDALSLRAAHLGVAMGRGSTDVAKEAADIILLDNNFKSIIAAIEEGRAIYITIKKVVLYLISTSIGEFLTILGALAIGLPLPLFPSQILWLNLITDGFLVVALALEPQMALHQSKRLSGVLFDSKRMRRSVIMGLVMMVGSLYVFGNAYGEGSAAAWTMSLTVLAVFQWFNAWNCRSSTQSIFHKPFSNPYLVLGLLASVFFHLFALYNPLMQDLLHTTPLTQSQWAYVVVVASSIVLVEEVRKFFARRKQS